MMSHCNRCSWHQHCCVHMRGLVLSLPPPQSPQDCGISGSIAVDASLNYKHCQGGSQHESMQGSSQSSAFCVQSQKGAYLYTTARVWTPMHCSRRGTLANSAPNFHILFLFSVCGGQPTRFADRSGIRDLLLRCKRLSL